MKLLNLLFDADLFLNLGFVVVPVGLGAPDDMPEELPPDRVDIDPLVDDEVIGYNIGEFRVRKCMLALICK